jgi:hypothetical protein
MRIEDYETPAIADEYAPRPKASQIAAAARRAGDIEPLTPIATVRNPAPANYLPIAAGAIVLGLAMIGMITWQLSRPMRPLAIEPTSAPAPTAAPTSTPAPTAAPTSTPAPTAAPTSTPAPAPAPVGRGMPADQVPADQVPAGDYIANVGAQAPHSPRGGLCGPTGGDCAPGVPYGLDNSQYIANVGAQAPHKVR